MYCENILVYSFVVYKSSEPYEFWVPRASLQLLFIYIEALCLGLHPMHWSRNADCPRWSRLSNIMIFPHLYKPQCVHAITASVFLLNISWTHAFYDTGLNHLIQSSPVFLLVSAAREIAREVTTISGRNSFPVHPSSSRSISVIHCAHGRNYRLTKLVRYRCTVSILSTQFSLHTNKGLLLIFDHQ